MLIAIDLIKSYNPCTRGINDFESKYPNYSDTLINLLQLEDVSYSDKVWLATKVVDLKTLQQWSVECAENVVENYNAVYPDDNRVSNCIEVTKKYLNDECGRDELLTARSEAEAAWSAAAQMAAPAAAWAAESARSAASSAAWSAQSAAAEAAQMVAAQMAAAASSAAWSAQSAKAESAEAAVAWAAWSADSPVKKEQEDINLSILIALLENEETDV